MLDLFGRNITYLRLSITDRCNLRCIYCMPECGVVKREHSEFLSNEEIEKIVIASAKCGIQKVRITGGEPLVRKGIVDICERVSAVEGINELCLTTNGILLPEFAHQLKIAGVKRLNISLDTLNPEKYKQVTRIGSLETALEGIKAAKDARFTRTKINVVLLGGVNDNEIESFVELTKSDNIQVRFIELMPIGECADWEKDRFISGSTVLSLVPKLEFIKVCGVAKIYKIPGYMGTVGLINPLSEYFCGSCNRIRVTADGKLKPCLHSNAEIDLRRLDDEQLLKTIEAAILAKPIRHHLNATHKSETTRCMNEIGG